MTSTHVPPLLMGCEVSPWTDGVGDQLLYVQEVNLWGKFHEQMADSNPNNIPVESHGIVVLANLFERARDLVQEAGSIIIDSDNAVHLIIDRIYKRDFLSKRYFISGKLKTQLISGGGSRKSYVLFEERFAAQKSKFNSRDPISFLPECMGACHLLDPGNVDENQRIAPRNALVFVREAGGTHDSIMPPTSLTPP